MLVYATGVSAQYSARIKETAELMAAATKKNDLNTLAKYTYPKVLAAMGGRDKMIAAIQKGFKEMAAKGITFKDVSLGEPGKVVKAGNELHCLIPQYLSLNVTGGYITSTSSLLAVSADQGKSWTYVDAGNMTEQHIKILFPNFNKSLVIPPKTTPVFHAD